MLENPNEDPISQVPTEILFYLFKLLPVKTLVISRLVCTRWREVIDTIFSDESFWMKLCEQEYNKELLTAKRKTNCCWSELYRSLTLWGRLCAAKESIDEFGHSSKVAEEILDVWIVDAGLIAVLRRNLVSYHDLSTLKTANRESHPGEFSSFVEFPDVYIIHSGHLHLQILKKPVRKIHRDHSWEDLHGEQIIMNIKYFHIHERDVYAVNFENEVFLFNLDQYRRYCIRPRDEDSIISITVCNGCLHILTFDQHIYAYQNNSFVKVHTMYCENNLLDCIYKYNFLEKIDWRTLYIWMVNHNNRLPDNLLRFITTVRIYNDLFFVGTNNGSLLVFYKPFVNGELDLFNATPVKNYTLCERPDIPILSLHPILKMDVVEIKDGHKVVIAMSRKIIVITYTHDPELEAVESKAIMPYDKLDIEALKMKKVKRNMWRK